MSYIKKFEMFDLGSTNKPDEELTLSKTENQPQPFWETHFNEGIRKVEEGYRQIYMMVLKHQVKLTKDQIEKLEEWSPELFSEIIKYSNEMEGPLPVPPKF